MAECAPDKVRSRSRGTRPRPGQSLSAAGAPARARGQQLRTRAAHASRGRGGPPRERPGRRSEPVKPRGPRQPHLRHAPDRRPPPAMRDLRQQSGSPHRGILSLQRRRGGTMEVGATTPGQLVLVSRIRSWRKVQKPLGSSLTMLAAATGRSRVSSSSMSTPSIRPSARTWNVRPKTAAAASVSLPTTAAP
jgi:hypothetical protein